MDKNSPYYRQVQLLIRLLPFIFQGRGFALKGGTAINLFFRNFPRLSVDIDLVYLGGEDREQALAAIHKALDRIAITVEQALTGAVVTKSYEQKPDALRLLVNHNNASIKIELSPVLRGVVHTPEIRPVVAQVEQEFGFAEVPVVAFEDLYAGKICAMLDRQHPRDFFDVLLLLENEGVSNNLRKAFLIYLVSHQRPMEEMLAPRWQPLQAILENEFQGMAFRRVSTEELESAGKKILGILLAAMTDNEKHFLCAFYHGSPDWEALGLDSINELPAVKWKLHNIEKMASSKREASLAMLQQVLNLTV